MPKMRVRGITIEINADMTGFVKNFKKSESEIKTIKSQLRDVDNLIKRDDFWAFKKNKGEVIDLLSQKQKYLAQDIDATKRKIAQEEQALKELGTADPTPETIQLQETLQRELYSDKLALEKLEQEQKEFGSVGKQIWQGYADGVKAAGEKMQELGQDWINTGTQLTASVTTPIVTAGTSIVNSAMDFETAMAKVKAVTQDASDTQLEALQELALELSTNTKYSATEAADALYYMGLAGWDADEMAKALPDVLNLAAAGDMELAKASDIVTDYITAFGLSADDTTYFVDVMAQTMANSNTTVEQLGNAFKYVAPVAGALGFSVEDVSLALGIMADNGIKASQAGTSLRQFMSRMAKPTAEVAAAMNQLGIALEDENGNAYTFKEILDQLRSSLNLTEDEMQALSSGIAQLDDAYANGELSEEEYDEALNELCDSIGSVTGAEKAKSAAILAGTRGMSGLLAIVNASAEDYDGLAEKINNSKDAAEDIADIMLNTTEGSFLKLKRTVEQFAISMGQLLLPTINTAITAIKEWVQKFVNLDDETKLLILKIAGVAAAIGPLVTAIGGLISAGGSLVSVVGTLMAHPLASAIGLVAVATAGLALGVHEAYTEMDKAAEAEYGLTEADKALFDRISETRQAYDDAVASRQAAIDKTEAEILGYDGLLESLGDIVDANGTIKEGYLARADYITNELSEALGIEIQINDGIISKYNEVKEAIYKIIEAKRQEVIINAYEDEYAEALTHVEQAQRDLILAEDDLIGKQEEAAEAQAAYDKLYAQALKENNVQGYASQLRQLEANLKAANEAEDAAREAVEKAQSTYTDYMTTIQNYEGVLSAVASGDVNALNTAISKLTIGFKTSTTATKEELAKQLEEFESQYGAMRQAVADGMPGVTQEQVEQMHRLVLAAIKELDDASGEIGWKERGKQWVKDTAEGMDEGMPKVKTVVKTMKDAILQGLDIDAFQTGHDLVNGLAQGMEENEHIATHAATLLANHVMDSINYVFDVGSPSKETMKVGRWVSDGLALGITQDAPKAIDAASNLAKDAMGAMNTKGFGDPQYGSSQTTNTYGAINVTINAANVQNDNQLAYMVADKINREVLRRRAAYT